MVTQIMTRSERRMEKRQALFLLVLVLAVALVSFSLGVIVGRGGKQSAQSSPNPERMPVAQAPPSSIGETPAAGGGGAASSPDHLTFYDALPKGEQPPLGSGINLPPEEQAPKPAPAPVESKSATPAVTQSPAKVPEKGKPASMASIPTAATTASTSAPSQKAATAPVSPKVDKEPEAKKPSEKVVAAAPKATHGTFIIQVASYPDAAGARKIRDRLAGRGFGAYIEEADLGSKGTWHRVMVGPFESDQAAAAAVSRLKADEKVAALVRRK